MSGLTTEEVLACVSKRDPDTEQFYLQQTMLRVKDPKKSLVFYSNVLGMRLLHKLDFPAMKFSVYFMGFEKDEDIPNNDEERLAWCFSRKGTLELTQYLVQKPKTLVKSSLEEQKRVEIGRSYKSNWGTESDETNYHNGNSEPRGFGHIGIAVPDLEASCERFEKMGVPFKKKPTDGVMKTIAFILDPDGYWIEIFNPKKIL